MGCNVIYEPSLHGNTLLDAIQRENPAVLVVRSTKVTSSMLDASSQLGIVIRAGAGFDTIDVGAASERGIFVSNCPHKNAIAVAELAWGLILSCDRRIPDQVAELREGKWNKKEFANAAGLYGRTLGVIGLGGIGKEVAKRGLSFGMRVVAWSRSLTDEQAAELGIERCEDLNELASISDAISVNVASTDETTKLIDETFLSTMKEGAIFVNTSRGNVIDEEALAAVIEKKKLRVGLDVYNNEPSSGDNTFTPAIVAKECVYGTHHVGASTQQAQDAITAETVKIISQFVLDGSVLNCVNLASSTPAKALLSVRHRNLPGVLSHVFEVISHAGVNVEEMENMMYKGSHAAFARIQLDDIPSQEQLDLIQSNENILFVTISPLNEGT